MLELTPRDDIRKTVSGILKRIEQLVRDGKLDLALVEIDRAAEIDPGNAYVHAYRECITSLKGEERRKRDTASQEKHEIEHRKTLQQAASGEGDRPLERARIDEHHKQQEALLKERNHRKHRAELEAYNQALFEGWHGGAASISQRRQLAVLQVSLNISQEEHEALEEGVRRECDCPEGFIFHVEPAPALIPITPSVVSRTYYI